MKKKEREGNTDKHNNRTKKILLRKEKGKEKKNLLFSHYYKNFKA